MESDIIQIKSLKQFDYFCQNGFIIRHSKEDGSGIRFKYISNDYHAVENPRREIYKVLNIDSGEEITVCSALVPFTNRASVVKSDNPELTIPPIFDTERFERACEEFELMFKVQAPSIRATAINALEKMHDNLTKKENPPPDPPSLSSCIGK